MANRLSKTTRVEITPGRPPVPATPPVCTEVGRVFVGWDSYTTPYVPATPPNYIDVVKYSVSGGEVTKVWIERVYDYGSAKPEQKPKKVKVPVYRTEYSCTDGSPGSPGVPGKVIKGVTFSWGDGARSLAPIDVDKGLQIDLRNSPVGIIVGVGQPFDGYEYGAYRSAIVVRESSVAELSNGIEGNAVPVVADRVVVARHSDHVRYIAGGHEVCRHPLGAQEKVHVSVALYSPADYVENPAFIPLPDDGAGGAMQIESYLDSTPGGVSALRIQAEGQDAQIGMSTLKIHSEAFALAGYSMSAVVSDTEASGYAATGGAGDIVYGLTSYAHGKLALAGFVSYSDAIKAYGKWPRYSGRGKISPAGPVLTSSYGVFASPRGFGHVLSGGMISAHGTQAAVGKASGSDWLGGTLKVYQDPFAGGWFDETEKTSVFVNQAILCDDRLELDSALLFALMERVTVGDEIDIYLLTSLSFFESVEAADSITFGGIIELMIQERLLASHSKNLDINKDSGQSTPGAMREAIQYAVNATTGALGRYENFGFTQFAFAGGRTYGITEDGLYRIGGEDDAGDMLNASIDFGASDYGTAKSKRVSSVYAGIATDGGVYIRVSGDSDGERVYRATAHRDEARAVTAKGVVARHWRVRLELTDASYADLDNMEIEIGASQRRLNRRGR